MVDIFIRAFVITLGVLTAGIVAFWIFMGLIIFVKSGEEVKK